MLTILGNAYRFCDGLSRRAFLKVGGLALGGLSLPELLRAEGRAGRRASHKAIIMIYLPGGPSHLDMYDLKPDAPADVRGEFKPIRTNVAGIQVCEHLPRLAKLMDRLVLVRSIVGAVDEHAAHLCLTGRPQQGPQPAGGWPSYGSVVAKALGPADRAVPPSVNLSPRMEHDPYNDHGPGFLGIGHASFRPSGETQRDLVLHGISLERLGDRQSLLASFDRLRRDLDVTGTMRGMDDFHRQALAVLTSRKLVEALDLSRENPRVRERYGKGDPRVEPTLKAAPRLMEPLLAARRLVEAGARCVTVAFGAWDWHEKNFLNLKDDLPLFDRGVAALVEDLHQRGLDKDVSVIAWGEFGRSPRINKAAGRDHWPAVSCALLAGGGMRTGQVIGTTDRLGERPRERPVHVQEVLATLYERAGVDLRQLTFSDLSGRPHALLDGHQPIRELS
jgi:hypothetical protein